MHRLEDRSWKMEDGKENPLFGAYVKAASNLWVTIGWVCTNSMGYAQVVFINFVQWISSCVCTLFMQALSPVFSTSKSEFLSLLFTKFSPLSTGLTIMTIKINSYNY